jgi:hypothetical protein
MEIKNYNELNALNKLLGKIKFQRNLDFDEFNEFVGSPIITQIFKRLNVEYWQESINQGFVNEDQKPEFEFESQIGKTLRLRIDNLTKQEKEALTNFKNVEFYIKTLISPLKVDDLEFNKMLKYAEEKINEI